MHQTADTATDDEALTGVLDEVTARAENGRADVDSLVDAAGSFGIFPVMTVIALIVVSPLSGIPFLSSICGFAITLSAVQAISGRERLQLPAFLRRQSVEPKRLVAAIGHVRRAAKWMEQRASRRLVWLSTPPMSRVFLCIAAFYGLCFPFMEVVPMSASFLGLAVALIGLGLILRDGLLLLLSLVPPLFAAVLIWTIWFS